MVLSAARASLRDEAPDTGASPHAGYCAKESAPLLHTTLPIVVSANRRSFIKEHFGADTNTSRTPERRWATYSRPRIGVRSQTGRVRPSPQTRRGTGPALLACENPARGVNRTSTQLYRVRTRSRLRVSFPLVAGSRGSTARRFRRVSCPASAGPQRHGPPPVTGVPARTRRASPYVPI